MSNFEYAGWISSIILGVVGFATTLIGWIIRGKQARSLAIKKDIHDTIDKAIAALNELEDLTYSFWSDPDTKVRLDQILAKHRRFSRILQQLQKLREFEMPTHEIGQLRRHATLDAESEARPLSSQSTRLRQFSKALYDIQGKDYLIKSWRD
jgi:uncharacterized membrane protein YheB (UPF0754 family)